MIRLLIEKTAVPEVELLAEDFCRSLAGAGFVRQENEDYILIITGAVPKELSRRRQKKALLYTVKAISSALVRYILFTLPSAYVKEYIEADKTLSDAVFDKKSIFSAVSERVRLDIRSDLKRKRRNWFCVLQHRILENMLENPTFAVSSFVRFRLQDYKNYVLLRVRSALYGIGAEMKYARTVFMLKEFVEKRCPELFGVRLEVGKDCYRLTDPEGFPIEEEVIKAAKTDGTDNEDLLVGVLIALAPVRITVSAEDEFFRTDIFSTLTNIFGSRIEVEYARNDNKNFFLEQKQSHD